MLRRLALAVAVALACLLGALWIVRGHPAPEHTLAFREEDEAARAVLDAVRGRGTHARALELLAGRPAWITVHDGTRDHDAALPVADAASLDVGPGDVLQVDVAIDPPFAADVTGPAGLGLDPGLDGAVTRDGEVRLPSWFLEHGTSRRKLARFFDEQDARVLRTYAVVETRTGPRRLLLGALLPEEGVDGARLMRAASSGGAYLARHTRPDGTFDYQVDASGGQASSGYNAVRHAGATYALLQLYRQQAAAGLAPDADVLRAAEQGLRWLVAHTRDDDADPTRAYLLEGNKIKLGGSALALMAMVERLRLPDASPEIAATAAKLARHLVSQQDARGRFASYYTPDDAHYADDRDSIYYPGEAVLALARYDLVAADPAHRWRAAAEAGARFLVDERHTALGVRVRTPVDAWLVLAVEQLDRTAPGGGYDDDDTLLRAVDLVTGTIAREGYRAGEVPEPMVGARVDVDFSSLISVGSRMEALGAAAALEARRAPSERRVRDAATANAAFGMRYQFDEDRLFLTADAARALGGVPTRCTDPRVRIDGVQHNLSGWLLLAAVLDGREPP